jgi:hypothetical protein
MSLASLEFVRAGRIWTVDGWLLAPHFNASCLGTCPKPARRKAASPSQSASFSLRVHDVRPVNPLHHLHEHSWRKVAAVRERPGSLKVRCARALLSRMLFPLGPSCSAHPLPLDEPRNLCMAADWQTGEGIEEAVEDGTHTSTPITDHRPPHTWSFQRSRQTTPPKSPHVRLAQPLATSQHSTTTYSHLV